MVDKTKEIHDLVNLHYSYVCAIRQYHNLIADGTKPWCIENEEIENARRDAEAAMHKYMDLIGTQYCRIENEVGEKLFKLK